MKGTAVETGWIWSRGVLKPSNFGGDLELPRFDTQLPTKTGVMNLLWFLLVATSWIATSGNHHTWQWVVACWLCPMFPLAIGAKSPWQQGIWQTFAQVVPPFGRTGAAFRSSCLAAVDRAWNDKLWHFVCSCTINIIYIYTLTITLILFSLMYMLHSFGMFWVYI